MNDVRRFPDFTNSLEWNEVARQAYVAQIVEPRGYIPIPAAVWTINNSHCLLIGTRSDSAERRWFLGARAQQILPFTPSSVSEYTNLTHLSEFKCGLGRLTLCTFPKFASTWLLRLEFPWWLQDVSVEIWRYDGRDVDLFSPGATRIEPSEVLQSDTPVILLPPNPNRKGAYIFNAGGSKLAIELDGDASFANSAIVLDRTGNFEAPYGFSGSISGVWEFPGTGHAEIREFL